MSARNYINDAPQTTTTGTLSPSQTSITVVSAAGFPAAPFIAALGLDATGGFTSQTELVLVTAVNTNILTVTRGFDSTPAVSHSSGETVTHTVAAIDLREANAHVNASSGVHGVSGALVGTTDPQTLSNKTLASPTVTGTLAVPNETVSGTLAVTGNTTIGGTATAASFTANGNGVVSGVVAPKTYANEAAAGTQPAGDIVYLTAPTGSSYLAGLFVSQGGGVWFPLNPIGKDGGTSIPIASTSTPGSGTATWLSFFNLAVPPWATRARVRIDISGMPVAPTGSAVGLAIKIGGITGNVQRITAQQGTVRWQASFSDLLGSLSSGAQTFTIQATFVVGTISVDNVSFVQIAVDYMP